MIEKIRQIIEKEYSNTLGIVVYKSGEKVLEEYFSGADKDESVHTFSMVKSIVAVLVGIFWCITIVGIPFGLQSFKLAKLAFMPFGARVTR